MKNVLFIGATGLLGKPVCAELVAAGFNVTALVRHPDAARSVLPPQVTLAQGDVKDPATLQAAFAGQEFVYINLSVQQTEKAADFHTETDGMKNILQAAKEAGVKRVVYLSSVVHWYNGFKWWVFDVKRKACRLVKESGVPYTIFYPTTFMETYAEFLQAGRFPMAGKGKYAMWFVSAKDYGKQVAQSLLLDKAANREYVVQGPEAVMQLEAAKRLAAAYTHKPVKIQQAPLWILKVLGLFSPRMNYLWHILQALNEYPEKFQAKITWDELGKPATTLEDFARSL
jgi:uncharacterized protein YbjT (DUF2867 family)